MLIEADNLGFYYKENKFCFRNLTFNLKENETLAILGLNGQGKSTLLANLIGILKPKEGSIKVNSSFSYLSQSLYLPFEYKVLDVVLMGRASKISMFKIPSKKDFDIARKSLDMLGISKLENENFSKLSGGQKQLVLFARALCGQNKILFLDEPMSALDLKNQDKILSLIQKLNNELKMSVIFTTHNPTQAFGVAHKTLILYKDLSFKFGDTQEILSSQAQEKLYEIQVKNIHFTHNNKKILSSVPLFSAQLA